MSLAAVTAGLRVVRSSPFAQLQDAGRFGVRHLGVTQGGALDWISMAWANWLLGNPRQAPVIEIAIGSFALVAETDTCLALGGADLGATLDGQPLAPWRSFTIRAGQRLEFVGPRQGVRAYLAAPGGFAAAPTLGSTSTVIREGLGGLDGHGRPLAVEDRLGWHGGALPAAPREMPADHMPRFEPSPRLDLVMGAQIGDFAGASLFAAFNVPWALDSRADRMGIRLLGPTLRCLRAGMVSEGIPLGAVQVPPDGQPIVLMNDRQTIGGYPRLGALAPHACARLAQCMPGESVQLAPVTQSLARDRHLALLRQW